MIGRCIDTSDQRECALFSELCKSYLQILTTNEVMISKCYWYGRPEHPSLKRTLHVWSGTCSNNCTTPSTNMRVSMKTCNPRNPRSSKPKFVKSDKHEKTTQMVRRRDHQPFAIGSHLSCSLTSKSPRPCVISPPSISLFSCSSPD